MAKIMDPILPILYILRYWAIILGSFGGPGKSCFLKSGPSPSLNFPPTCTARPPSWCTPAPRTAGSLWRRKAAGSFFWDIHLSRIGLGPVPELPLVLSRRNVPLVRIFAVFLLKTFMFLTWRYLGCSWVVLVPPLPCTRASLYVRGLLKKQPWRILGFGTATMEYSPEAGAPKTR